MKKIEQIIEKQKEFQRFVGFPIDSNLENDRNELSEKYVFKLIEEAIELRKEFPSTMNPWSKKQKEADFTRIKEEMSDIFLFFMNLLITWKFSFEEIVEMVEKVQDNNFMKVKEKKMKMLNERILNIPGYTSGIGGGNLNPKYIFINQTPSSRIEHGESLWNNEKDESSRKLMSVLDSLGIRMESYYTTFIKSVGNRTGTSIEELNHFWTTYSTEELEILKSNNPDSLLISLVDIPIEDYQKEIEHAIKQL